MGEFLRGALLLRRPFTALAVVVLNRGRSPLSPKLTSLQELHAPSFLRNLGFKKQFLISGVGAAGQIEIL